MKKRPGLRLRKFGRKHILIDTMQPMVNLTDVYTLNDTAAFLWESAPEGEVSEEALAARLSAEYDVDEATALRDVRLQLSEWVRYGLFTS